MKKNKGITLTSLVIYIALIFVVLAILMRITTYFSNNMQDVADVSFETEFNKLNLYLLDETKQTGNAITEIIEDGTQVTFLSGNKYTYNAEDEKVYLNDTIKVCEGVESCIFKQETAENLKSVLVLTITINETTKTVEYVMSKEANETTSEVNINDYLWGVSLVTYYLKVGDYVDYTPDTGTYEVAAGEYGSGYELVQSFATETGDSSLKWRVLSIDEQTGEIELVSATVGQTLHLQGADGYNHGVDILNDLCERLYSKTVNGVKVATARSIKVEDINAKTTYDYTTYYTYIYGFTYGDKKQLSTYGTSYMNYPSLYSKEIGYGTKNVFNTAGLGGSEGLDDGVTDNSGITTYSTVTGSADGNTKGTDPYITYTYYYYSPGNYLKQLGVNTASTDLINLGTTYWLASRSVAAMDEAVAFYVRVVTSGGNVSQRDLFRSNGNSALYSVSVRPVVTLSATELVDFSVGDGSEENPWGMK